MATFDQLPADQRAIIELVLQRGQSYEDLSGMLGLPAARVRELARDALADLTPATARRVDDDWRAQVADYVLGQQSGPESSATRIHLRRSEPARTWALSLLDALDSLYANGTRPEIPEADTGPARPRSRPRSTTRPRGRAAPRPSAPRPTLSPDARATVRRRRLAAGVALLVIAAVAVGGFIWPKPFGDDDNNGGNGDEAAEQPVRVLGSPIVLRPVRGTRDAGGSAVVAQQGDQRVLVVQARGLEPTPTNPTEENPGSAYEVWFYNSRGDAKSVGAQLTDQEGNLTGAAPLPDDFQNFRFVDVSSEPIDDNERHSGRSVLRGSLADLARPPEEQPGGAGAGGTQTQPQP